MNLWTRSFCHLAVLFSATLTFTGCVAAEPQFPKPSDYESCLMVPHRILKSLPPRCISADGQSFVKTEKTKLCRDQCGNGTCEEIVCMGEACPCAENAQNCPKDCSGK